LFGSPAFVSNHFHKEGATLARASFAILTCCLFCSTSFCFFFITSTNLAAATLSLTLIVIMEGDKVRRRQAVFNKRLDDALVAYRSERAPDKNDSNFDPTRLEFFNFEGSLKTTDSDEEGLDDEEEDGENNSERDRARQQARSELVRLWREHYDRDIATQPTQPVVNTAAPNVSRKRPAGQTTGGKKLKDFKSSRFPGAPVKKKSSGARQLPGIGPEGIPLKGAESNGSKGFNQKKTQPAQKRGGVTARRSKRTAGSLPGVKRPHRYKPGSKYTVAGKPCPADRVQH
jgi:hypothetical protein